MDIDTASVNFKQLEVLEKNGQDETEEYYWLQSKMLTHFVLPRCDGKCEQVLVALDRIESKLKKCLEEKYADVSEIQVDDVQEGSNPKKKLKTIHVENSDETIHVENSDEEERFNCISNNIGTLKFEDSSITECLKENWK